MTRLSNRQFPMLRAFIELRGGEYMSVEEAQKFDQRPFRSMLIQQWVTYSRGHGFQSTQIFRKNPSLPLTSYFDAQAYGLKRVHEMPKRRVA